MRLACAQVKKSSIRKPPGLWARKGPTDTAQVYTWSAVGLQLRLLENRLAARRITLDVTPAAREWLADVGYETPSPIQAATIPPNVR